MSDICPGLRAEMERQAALDKQREQEEESARIDQGLADFDRELNEMLDKRLPASLAGIFR